MAWLVPHAQDTSKKEMNMERRFIWEGFAFVLYQTL
jgi:hypothetical protein